GDAPVPRRGWERVPLADDRRALLPVLRQPRAEAGARHLVRARRGRDARAGRAARDVALLELDPRADRVRLRVGHGPERGARADTRRGGRARRTAAAADLGPRLLHLARR